MTPYSPSGLRATISALLADEDSGCDRRHLDRLMEDLAHASSCHDELVDALRKIANGYITDTGPHQLGTVAIGELQMMEIARRAIAKSERK